VTVLKAENSIEKVILDYINENASESLVEKINNGTKTMRDCIEFIKGQAKKEASNGSAMVEDKKVFGWAIHFFEEDSIKANQPVVSANVKVSAPEKKEIKAEKKPEKKVAAESDNQISMFDLFGVK